MIVLWVLAIKQKDGESGLNASLQTENVVHLLWSEDSNNESVFFNF